MLEDAKMKGVQRPTLPAERWSRISEVIKES